MKQANSPPRNLLLTSGGADRGPVSPNAVPPTACCRLPFLDTWAGRGTEGTERRDSGDVTLRALPGWALCLCL